MSSFRRPSFIGQQNGNEATAKLALNQGPYGKPSAAYPVTQDPKGGLPLAVKAASGILAIKAMSPAVTLTVTPKSTFTPR